MPVAHILFVYLISVLLVFLPSFGLAKMFQKSGVASWKAYIPFYNTWVMQELSERPKHWVFWQLIPVVGWFITPGIFIEFVKLYGRFGFGEHVLAALFAPFYFPYLGYNDKVHYIGLKGARLYKKPGWREWVDAAIFAIVAATLIRTFVFEAYTIPSSSMEKTLLINDFLFVSKFSYGPRIPNTPLSIPFVHNYIPGTHMKSYSEALQLPYIRWFSSPVERGDVVVFNYPEGDTVINRDDYQSAHPFYQKIREDGNGDPVAGRKRVLDDPKQFPLAVHPPDKSDNYIKRCVGIPGDMLQVRNDEVIVNNQPQASPPKSMMLYNVVTTTPNLDAELMKENYGVDLYKDAQQNGAPGNYLMNLTQDAKTKMKEAGLIKEISLQPLPVQQVFPYDEAHRNWNIDNFGPIWIPKKGVALKLDFLPKGRSYDATIYADDPAAPTATHVGIRTRTVDAGAVLQLDLPASGGQAIWLRPR